MVDVSGGTSEGVQTRAETLGEEDAASVEKSIRRMVQKRQRDESPSAENPSQR